MRSGAHRRGKSFFEGRPGHRVCTVCKVEKPLAEFASNKRVPSGTASHCKACKLAMLRDYRARKAAAGITPTDQARFWQYVDKGPHPKGCWLWTGSIRNAEDGYGQFELAGRNRPAHVASLILHGRPKPPGNMFADHMCKVRQCVNPDHLRWVTPRINAVENSESVFAQNAAKTHCAKGHAFTPENTALYVYPTIRTRHGNTRPNTERRAGRVCLTCFPNYWRFAIVPRDPPPGARTRAG